jgi:signal transduction histidine kinase
MVNNYPGAISQIITNLINNSLMHGYKDSGSGKFELQAKQDGDWIELIYTDDGVGIDGELLNRVFEPYYTTKAREGGSGLGMGIIKRLVEQDLGGEMSIQSEINKGVKVTIRFPVDMSEP